jgi:hypothetical protein
MNTANMELWQKDANEQKPVTRASRFRGNVSSAWFAGIGIGDLGHRKVAFYYSDPPL